MKKRKLIFGGLAVMILTLLLISGCTTNDNNKAIISDNAMMEDDDVMVEKDRDSIVEKNDTTMEESNEEMMIADGYQGEVLAGSITPYITFNKVDYDKAISENKIVVLYFYANWCPSCKAEQVEIFEAFNELQRPDVVGFRVNYRDSDVDDFEENLAKEHGVTYQHTKVILQNGERILKVPNSWKKNKYIEEINKVV